MGRRSPGPFDREPHGRGRATSKYPPRDDFKKPFRPRRESFGEDRKPFGRGRGRGFSKDYPQYDRNEQYHRRNNSGGDLMEMDRISGFPGGEPHSHNWIRNQDNSRINGCLPYLNLPESTRDSNIRYFMIKSFNQENVKMAQQDVMISRKDKNF
jgi:hypothetical protein